MINIKIDTDGNVHVDVAGVAGATCENLTAQLIAGLGEVEEKCYTEEYDQTLPDYINNQSGDE